MNVGSLQNSGDLGNIRAGSQRVFRKQNSAWEWFCEKFVSQKSLRYAWNHSNPSRGRSRMIMNPGTLQNSSDLAYCRALWDVVYFPNARLLSWKYWKEIQFWPDSRLQITCFANVLRSEKVFWENFWKHNQMSSGEYNQDTTLRFSDFWRFTFPQLLSWFCV